MRRSAARRCSCPRVRDLSFTTPNSQLPTSKITDRNWKVWFETWGLFFQPPPHEHRADGESGADRSEKKEVTPLQTFLFDGVVERERNGARSRVAESLDVNDDLSRWDP